MEYGSDATRKTEPATTASLSGQQLALISDIAPTPIVYLDSELRFRYANQAYLSMSGRDWKAIQGRAVEDVVNAGAMEIIEPLLNQCLAGESVRAQRSVPMGAHLYELELAYEPDWDENEQVRGVVLTLNDVTRRQEAERELKTLNGSLEARIAERTAEAERRANEMQRLAAELTRAEERERRRLARTLHDHVQQLLIAAKIQLSMLRRSDENSQIRQFAEQIDELLNEAIEASRSLTFELNPPVLNEKGLCAALHWLSNRMQEMYRLHVDLELDRRADPPTDDVRVFLFHTTRELLCNVVKHAGVNRATVRLVPDGAGQAQLTVEDTGIGFSLEQMHKRADHQSYGLFNIRERLEVRGGQMEIRSQPGNGTQVVLTVPLSEPQSDSDGEASP